MKKLATAFASMLVLSGAAQAQTAAEKPQYGGALSVANVYYTISPLTFAPARVGLPTLRLSPESISPTFLMTTLPDVPFAAGSAIVALRRNRRLRARSCSEC